MGGARADLISDGARALSPCLAYDLFHSERCTGWIVGRPLPRRLGESARMSVTGASQKYSDAWVLALSRHGATSVVFGAEVSERRCFDLAGAVVS